MTLKVECVTKKFQSMTAVEGIGFEVPEGSIFGLLGANGAGKTTTVRMILDIIRPDEGEITWRGKPAREVSRRAFGYLPEERGLYSDMKVGEQLRFFGRLRGLSAGKADEQAERARRLGVIATLVGAITLSRACPDNSPLADDILQACRDRLLTPQ